MIVDPSSPSGVSDDDGNPIGSFHGYWYVYENGVRHFAHRWIYSQLWGEVPPGWQVDHKDCDPANNHPSNLRLATPEQNMANRSEQANKLSVMPKGIYHNHTSYRASVQANGKRIWKCSKDLYKLLDWLNEKRSELHGEFARV